MGALRRNQAETVGALNTPRSSPLGSHGVKSALREVGVTSSQATAHRPTASPAVGQRFRQHRPGGSRSSVLVVAFTDMALTPRAH